MNFTISRDDQCDHPSGGALRVAARILARMRVATCSRPAPRLRSSRPATPSAAYRANHRSTVGRDTPPWHRQVIWECLWRSRCEWTGWQKMVADFVFQAAAAVMIWFQTAKRLVISVRHSGALIR